MNRLLDFINNVVNNFSASPKSPYTPSFKTVEKVINTVIEKPSIHPIFLYGAQEIISQILAEKISTDANKNRKLQKGDVIAVNRTGYRHYGVYIGEGNVIHYSSESSDISLDNKIIKTDFLGFLKNAEKYFILNLEYIEPRMYSHLVNAKNLGQLEFSRDDNSKYLIGVMVRTLEKTKKREVFSSEETVARAESRLGESKYCLLSNNCEHFAVWCKTGISDSSQVKSILDALPHIAMNI